MRRHVMISKQKKLLGWTKYLHSNREVVLGFRWKEDVDGFLRERLIARRRRSDFNDVQLEIP